jgi:glycosyltransferase 2 family protein
MKKHSVVIGFLISAIFLYLVFRKIELRELSHQLAAANYWYLIPASLLTILALWIRSVRWGVLLHPVQVISQADLFSSTSIGFMCNNILPMRLGELIRAYVLRRKTNIRGSTAFATIVVERLFDLFTMIAIFGVILLFEPFHNRSFKLGAFGAFIAGIIALIVLILFYLFPTRFELVLSKVLPATLREKVIRIFRSFASGLGVLSDYKRLLLTGLLTVVMWLLITVVIKMCFSAARLEETGMILPPSSSLVVLVVIAIGVMVPSGPGFVGTLQAAAVLGLAIVGYTDHGRALSFSILYHITQWVPVVLVGFYFLMRENLSLTQMGKLTQSDELDD